MKTNRVGPISFLAIIVTCMLCACNGGGSNLAGIDGSGSRVDTVNGPINGFGSVIVNGTRFNTDSAEFFVRGEPAAESTLRVGNYVTVVGNMDEAGKAVAQQVYYEPNVSGTVTAKNSDADTVTLVGQKVKVNSETIFSSNIQPKNIDGLQNGMQLTVSGSADAEGVIHATRIELTDEEQGFELSGPIRQLDVAERTFALGGVLIAYGSAVANVALQNGLNVWVSGSEQDGTYVAEHIREQQGRKRSSVVRRTEVNGYISDYQDALGMFQLNGFTVLLSHDTDVVWQSTNALNNGLKVLVIGELNEDVLLADKIVVQKKPSLQTIGTIDDITYLDEDFFAKIIVGDTEIHIARNTTISSHFDNRLEFRELSVGDFVVVNAAESDGEVLVARRLHVESQTENRVVEAFGIATRVDKASQAFSLRNTRVLTGDNTQYRSTSSGQEEVGFDEVAGSLVEAQGTYVNGTLLASQVTIYIQDDMDDFEFKKFVQKTKD